MSCLSRSQDLKGFATLIATLPPPAARPPPSIVALSGHGLITERWRVDNSPGQATCHGLRWPCPQEATPSTGLGAPGARRWGAWSMTVGTAIVVAEVRLTPSSITWRVRPAAGWASVGGLSAGGAGVLALQGWEDRGAALPAEACRALLRASAELGRMATELESVRALPMG